VHAQPPAPPRFDDLPRLAEIWPPKWAALAREIVPPRENFEKSVLAKVEALLNEQKPNEETYPLAEIILAATLRHHQGMQRTAPLAEDPHQGLQTELQDRLAVVRADWLKFLRSNGRTEEAAKLADRWLPASPAGSALPAAILALWT